MKLKKMFSFGFGMLGVVLVFYSIIITPVITGEVIGVDGLSKYLGIFGVLFMIVAIVIERSGGDVSLKKKCVKKRK
jgi:hypothetical protein